MMTQVMAVQETRRGGGGGGGGARDNLQPFSMLSGCLLKIFITILYFFG